MLNAAIIGLGWWGKRLVESVAGSDAIRFVHPPGYSYFTMLREKLRWSNAVGSRLEE